MSEQGVPSSVLVGEDHIQVRAALISLLKGANQAVVWTRIEYRARHVAFAHEHQGRQWWEVKAEDLGREVGLTKSQVETAVGNLVEKGFLLAEQHSLPMQTVSYSPVILQSGEIGIGPVPDRESPDSSSENSELQIGDSGIAPLYEEREDVQDTPVVPDVDVFDLVWSHWPKKVDKKQSRDRFQRALKKHPQLAADVIRFGDAYSDTTPTEFVPGLATWILRERWDDALPTPRGGARPAPADRAASVIEMGQRLARGEQKSVGA